MSLCTSCGVRPIRVGSLAFCEVCLALPEDDDRAEWADLLQTHRDAEECAAAARRKAFDEAITLVKELGRSHEPAREITDLLVTNLRGLRDRAPERMSFDDDSPKPGDRVRVRAIVRENVVLGVTPWRPLPEGEGTVTQVWPASLLDRRPGRVVVQWDTPGEADEVRTWRAGDLEPASDHGADHGGPPTPSELAGEKP